MVNGLTVMNTWFEKKDMYKSQEVEDKVMRGIGTWKGIRICKGGELVCCLPNSEILREFAEMETIFQYCFEHFQHVF